MKKYLISITAAFAIILWSVPSATAVTVSATNAMASVSDPNTPQPSYLYDLTPTSLTNLNTTLAEFGASIMRRKGSFYYTNSHGILKQKLGSSTASTLKNGADFEQIAAEQNLLVVNNDKTKKSFLYDVDKKKITQFSLKIGLIEGADLSPNASQLVVTGKNNKGKEKIFISTTAPDKLKEYALPKGMTSCSRVAISTNMTHAAIICTDGTATPVYILDLNGSNMGKTHKTVSTTFLPHSIVWLGATKLIVGGYDISDVNNPLHVIFKSYSVSAKGAVTTTATLSANPDSLNPAPNTVNGLDYQLLRQSSTGFYYGYLFLGTGYYGQSIVHFNTKTGTETVLLHNGLFNLLTETPNPSPTT